MTECGGKTFAKPKEVLEGPSNQSNAAEGKGDWELLDAVDNYLWTQGLPSVPMYVFDQKNVYKLLPNPIGQSPIDTFTTKDRAIVSCGVV